MSATILRRRITGALRTSKDAATVGAAEEITQNTVYNYPTIDRLASFLASAVAGTGGIADTKTAQVLMEEMIAKYSAGLDETLPTTSDDANRPRAVVLLTGSTGNLGSQILASLLTDEKVERVYALNRPSSGSTSTLERHRQRFEDKALDIALLASKRLIFIEGDAASENLGLPDSAYIEVKEFGKRHQLDAYIPPSAPRFGVGHHSQCLETRFQPFTLVL